MQKKEILLGPDVLIVHDKEDSVGHVPGPRLNGFGKEGRHLVLMLMLEICIELGTYVWSPADRLCWLTQPHRWRVLLGFTVVLDHMS